MSSTSVFGLSDVIMAPLAVVYEPDGFDPDTPLCDLDLGLYYETYLLTQTMTVASVDGAPSFVAEAISDPVEYDGMIAAPPALTTDQQNAVQAFADAVDAMSATTFGLILQDFETLAFGNFAGSASTYVANAGSTHTASAGTMSDGTASGRLVIDGLMSINLFNTGNTINTVPSNPGDDPGVATNTGNDADRGYNRTSGGSQYLEVLPGEQTDGGVMLCFDEEGAPPIYGFAFTLMGREETKRDVYLDIHFSDGSVYRSLTGTNPLNAGGEQFYSYVLDVDAATTIEAIVLYEPHAEGEDGAELRDIFSIDDLALVVSGKQATTTIEEYVAALSGDGGGVPVNGSESSDNLRGTSRGEMINGFGGWDWITPGGGNDTIDGGDGRDMVSFVDLADTPGRTNTQYRLTIDLEAGTGTSHDGSEQIVLRNVERVTGSIYADYIRGDAGDNELRGLGDYDWFIATEGRDTIDGGNGKDMISFLEWENDAENLISDAISGNGAPPSGSEATGVLVDLANPSNNTGLAAGLTLTSIERVTGSGRQDVFYGDSGQNDFRGLGDYDWFVSSTGGRERYFGGDGLDTVTYYNASSGVIANLRNGATVNGQETGYGTGGDAALDLYFEIENLVGSNYGDSLTGNSGRNQLNGLDGDDFLFGYGGVDYLKGGGGNDTISGGAGSDYAFYDGNAADHTLTKTDWNKVTVSGGSNGTDSLTDVEYFVFDDQTVTIWELSII